MSVKILARRLGTNPKACRCWAHEGQIQEKSQCEFVRVRVADNTFNLPVCSLCSHKETRDLISAMITEARRHKAASTEPGKFTILMSMQEQP